MRELPQSTQMMESLAKRHLTGTIQESARARGPGEVPKVQETTSGINLSPLIPEAARPDRRDNSRISHSASP